MAKNPSDQFPYYILAEKRDYLDIMDSYKYMNPGMISDLFSEGIWDHGAGWTQLNYSSWDWRHRHNIDWKPPFPESTSF